MTFFQQMHIKRHRYRRTREYPLEKASSLVPLLCYLFALLLFVTVLPSSAFGGVGGVSSSDSVSALRKGKELLEKGTYDKALESLQSAYAELPVIGDYTLLFVAKAYNRLERFDESSRCIGELLKTYPDSPLVKRARALQINNVFLTRDIAWQNQKSPGGEFPPPLSAGKSEEALKYVESYAADYPDDAGMSFFFARLLKNQGRTDRAKKLFLKIYSGNNGFSELARQELQPSDITPEDMFAKASNLMKAFEHKKAEVILRKILPAAREPFRGDVLKTLGQALFRQKRYREASEVFLKAGDIYNGSRSLFRAGDLSAFTETVSRLSSMKDKRAGSLLIAYAAKKRRDGKMDEAVDIYQDVKRRYPVLTEDALWGIAWSHYRSGDFNKAEEYLTSLTERYPNSRYSYWKQRCGERETTSNTSEAGTDDARIHPQGDKPVTLPNSKSFRKDFYRMLAYVGDTDNFSGRAPSRASWSRSGRAFPDDSRRGMEPQRLPPDILPLYERFTILMELGMKDDAVVELVRLSNKITHPDLLLSLCRMLQDIGAYKRSISMISRFSDEKGLKWGDGTDVADILYPLAYWQTVSEISEHYALDPFILLAVMREESRFDPQARSIAGALGLMQIMPHTAFSLDKQLKMDIADASEIYNIRINITVGAYYLNSLLKEFASLPVALAAYNAGHDRVREWVKEGRYRSYDEFVEDIPYDETRNYVKRVLLTYFTYLSLGDRQERGN
jgi:soluble lytic murein transglycosylase